MKHLIWLVMVAVLLIGCSPAPALTPTGAAEVDAADAAAETVAQTGMGMGMGMGGGMMERHHAAIPDEYSGLASPAQADEASIERGGALYATNCASCHGDGGMGDGIAGAALNPAPAAVAHTSQMMGDNYLYWRISEGGAQFSSAMPAWKDILDEQARWDLIHYMRALGAGKAAPASQMGGALYDPAAQAAHQAEMLANAVEQGVITQAEAEMFKTVHDATEAYRAAHPEMASSGLSTDENQAAMLAALVKAQTITQEQADAFKDIHDRIGAAGLMQ